MTRQTSTLRNKSNRRVGGRRRRQDEAIDREGAVWCFLANRKTNALDWLYDPSGIPVDDLTAQERIELMGKL